MLYCSPHPAPSLPPRYFDHPFTVSPNHPSLTEGIAWEELHELLGEGADPSVVDDGLARRKYQ
jgi:hypothetical protein